MGCAVNTLRELRNLQYDTTDFNSGLICWYKVATEKAIKLFLNDPYDGEYRDDELLNILCSFDVCKF